MKRKILSVFLVTVILLITASIGFSANSENENLISNGNFEEYSNNLPTNWKVNLMSNTTATVVEDVQLASGITANAMKFTTSAASNSRSDFYYTETIKIEKNTTYTTTFWVKSDSIAGFRAYMYEPVYINTSGTEISRATALEGQNIYSYSYDNGSTRVIRTDVTHSWTVKETGAVIDGVLNASMMVHRSGNTPKYPSADFPNQEKAGEWVQIQHTFKTGNDAAHEAEVSYDFVIPEVADGEFWIANIAMTAVKDSVNATLTPAVNDDTLGTVLPYGAIPLTNGVKTTLTADAFGENIFNGWFLSDTCVSTEPTLTFTYSGGTVPQYEARFTKADFGINGSYEDTVTTGKVANVVHANASAWTESGFKTSSIDGIHFADSVYGGTYRSVKTSTANPHTGEYSLEASLPYTHIGRKITNLTKNSNYTVTFYACFTTTGTETSNLSHVTVTTADYSPVKSPSSGKLANRTADDTGVLYYDATSHNINNNWTKITVPFSSGDNTEVIVWASHTGTSSKLYLDNFAIARENVEYTPEVNNPALGFTNTVSAKAGDEITLKATALGEAVFDGWYAGGERLSTDAEFTTVFDNTEYTAHFTASEFGIDGSYETGYTANQVLAESGNTSVSTWTEESFLSASNDKLHFIDSINKSPWAKAYVTDKTAHTGNYSLAFNSVGCYMGRKFEGLLENTDYVIDFYIRKLDETDSVKKQIKTVIITSGDTSCVSRFSDTALTLKGESSEDVVYKKSETYQITTEWEKQSVIFNTHNNRDVILWLYTYGTASEMYIDNFSISRTAKFSVKNSRLGRVTHYDENTVALNSSITLTATPYKGNSFDGWYINDTLISTETTHTFHITEDMGIVPKFSGKNMPNYDYFEAINQDGTFENGTITGWTFDDPSYDRSWCSSKRTTNEAYEGEYSLEFNSRYSDSVLTLENLFTNTNYTLSFYVKFNATDENAVLSSAAILPYKATNAQNSPEVIALSGPLAPSDEWQKMELSFNSGDHTALNFVFRYETDDQTQRLYIDNLVLEVKEYTGAAFTPGNINGDENDTVDLQDLVTLAQYVAEWENLTVVTEALDVNGDSKSDLNDVVHLSRYLAEWEGITLSTAPYSPAE